MTVVGDALATRDCSGATRSAIQRLAIGALQAHPAEPQLMQRALLCLEALFGDDRVPYLGRLDERLRRGQEVQAFAAVRDWIESGMRRGKYSLLFAFTTALGRRAYLLPELQEMLRRAVGAVSPSSVVCDAIRHWLADPRAREERVEKVLRADPSTIAISDVWQVVDGQRTDLLDLVLGKKPPAGPFLAKNLRWVPGSAHHVRRWLPRQRERYLGLLITVAGDAGAAVHTRASAVSAAARLPDLGWPAVQRWIDSPTIPLAEAAMAALPWTDRPSDALPYLLAHTGDDRARVAVYAARRASRFLSPSRLGQVLAAELPGQLKVTSRKEILRLAADFSVPDADDILYAEWCAPDTHRDVRASIVGAARTRRDLPHAWDILTGAATSGQYAEALQLCAIDALSLPDDQRSRYAALLLECCRSADNRIAEYAWSRVPAWAPWAGDISAAILDGLTDLSENRPWRHAATTLVALVRAGDSGPVLDTCLRRLVEVDRDDDGADPARDRPALARGRYIVDLLVAGAVFGESSLDRTAMSDAARLLAAYDPLAPAAAKLLLASLPDDANVFAGLADICDQLASRPVTASTLAADVVRMAQRRGWTDSIAPAIAARLSDRGDLPGGLFAVALAGLGRTSGWAPPYRALVLRLRAHPMPDVRAEALAISLTPK